MIKTDPSLLAQILVYPGDEGFISGGDTTTATQKPQAHPNVTGAPDRTEPAPRARLDTVAAPSPASLRVRPEFGLVVGCVGPFLHEAAVCKGVAPQWRCREHVSADLPGDFPLTMGRINNNSKDIFI